MSEVEDPFADRRAEENAAIEERRKAVEKAISKRVHNKGNQAKEDLDYIMKTLPLAKALRPSYFAKLLMIMAWLFSVLSLTLI